MAELLHIYILLHSLLKSKTKEMIKASQPKYIRVQRINWCIHLLSFTKFTRNRGLMQERRCANIFFLKDILTKMENGRLWMTVTMTWKENRLIIANSHRSIRAGLLYFFLDGVVRHMHYIILRCDAFQYEYMCSVAMTAASFNSPIPSPSPHPASVTFNSVHINHVGK